jgi:hypothetical protein
MAPLLPAATEQGELWFVPTSLTDVRAKSNFANTARLMCVAYNATAVTMALESWATFAKFTSFQGRFAGLLPPKVPDAKARALGDGNHRAADLQRGHGLGVGVAGADSSAVRP